MASVTGMTAEAVNEALDEMVISIRVDQNGQLIFKTRDGEEENVGTLLAPKLAVEAAYPVGSIYMSAVPTNPAQLLGVGTWVRHANGRVIVGVDEGQTEFDAPGETGGSKTVTLTAAQSGLPAHKHTVALEGNTGTTLITANVSDLDASTNPDTASSLDRGSSGGGSRQIMGSGHTHSVNLTGETDQVAAAPASAAHTNLQPYITAYIWRRTV